MIRRTEEHKMKYNWNKEQFIQDYDLLKSSRKMADKYKVNRKAILSFAKQIGYQNTNMGVKITEEIKPYLREQYYYKSSTELSKELNISASTIAGFWRREGLKGKKRRVYHYNEHYFQNIDTPEKAYWLGLLAADGCICHTNDARQDLIVIHLIDSDSEILEKFNKTLYSNKPLCHYTRKLDNRKYVKFEISSDIMSADLAKYNIVPKKTNKYLFPDNINAEYYKDFIRGYFDGDGCISHNFQINTLHAVNVSITGFFKNLLRFQQVLAEEGINATLIEDKRNYKSEDKFGALCFTSKIEKAKFLNYIYSDATIFLERKHKLAQKFIELVSINDTSWKLKK